MEKINQKQFLAAMQSPSKQPISSEEEKSNYISPNSVAVAMEYEQKRAGQNETPEDRRFISELFSRLNTICTAGFHNLKMLSADEAQGQIKLNMREWMNEFQLQGMNEPKLVDYALGRIRASGSPFIPTVGEFLVLCEEGRIPSGVKTHTDSFKEISGWLMQAGDRRLISDLSDSVYHTYVNMEDQQGFRQMGDRIKRMDMWRTEYQKTLDLLKEGRHIRTAPPANQMQLNQTKARPASKEQAMSALAAMRKGL